MVSVAFRKLDMLKRKLQRWRAGSSGCVSERSALLLATAVISPGTKVISPAVHSCGLKVKRESERQAELWLWEFNASSLTACLGLPSTRVKSQEETRVCVVLGWSIMGTPAQFCYQLKTPLIYFSLSRFSPCLSFCWCWGLLLVGFVCLFVLLMGWTWAFGVAQAGLKLMTILLLQPSEYLNYRHELPHLASHSYLLTH